jgi:small subunit ribosomal protein S17
MEQKHPNNQANQPEARKKTFTGKVVSDKMKDTIVVAIENFKKVPKYEKYIQITKRFKAHDAGNTKKIGDVVTIEETRPISKDKKFRVIA